MAAIPETATRLGSSDVLRLASTLGITSIVDADNPQRELNDNLALLNQAKRARLEMRLTGLGTRYFQDVASHPAENILDTFPTYSNVNTFLTERNSAGEPESTLHSTFLQTAIGEHFQEIARGLDQTPGGLAYRTERLFRAVLELRDVRVERGEQNLQIPDADLIQNWTLQLIHGHEFHQIARLAFGDWVTRLSDKDKPIPHIFQANETIAQLVAATLKEQGQITGIRAVDLGAGTGATMLALLTALTQQGISVESMQGVDITPVLVQKAQQLFNKNDFENVSVSIEIGDALTWLEKNVDDNSLDIVSMVYAIHHLPYDQQKQLEQLILTKLKPGGMFALADPTGRSEFNRKNLDINEPEATAACFRPYLSEVAAELNGLGFTVAYQGFEQEEIRTVIGDITVTSTQQGNTLDQGTLGYALVATKPTNTPNPVLNGELLALQSVIQGKTYRNSETGEKTSGETLLQSFLSQIPEPQSQNIPVTNEHKHPFQSEEIEPSNPFPERLAVINEAYNLFLQAHPEELSRLESMSEERAVELGNELIVRIAIALGIDPSKKVRALVTNYLRTQLHLLHGEDSAVFLKRHGKQVHENPDNLEPTELKTLMMQKKANEEDHADLVSLAEAAGDAFLFQYMARRLGKHIAIQTSPDARSQEVAQVFGVITGADAQPNEDLRCMRYKDTLSDVAQYVLHLPTNLGTVPWEKPAIDAVAERGTFEMRPRRIRSLFRQVLQIPHTLTVLVGHAQELQIMSGQQSLRAAELGVVIALPQDNYNTPVTTVMSNGLFTDIEQARVLRPLEIEFLTFNTPSRLERFLRRVLRRN